MQAHASVTISDVAPLAGEKTRTDTIDVPDMQCGMCEKRIAKTLQKIDGVESVEADAETKWVIVNYDAGQVTRQRIEEAIARVGYDAGSAKTTTKARESLPGCCLPPNK